MSDATTDDTGRTKRCPVCNKRIDSNQQARHIAREHAEEDHV